MSGCSSGKMPYINAKEAKGAIREQKRKCKRNGYRHPARTFYRCEWCDMWHLTSKSKSELKRNAKLKAKKDAEIAYTAQLAANNTVTWFLAHPDKRMSLEILNDKTVLALYDVDGVSKYVMLRNI